MTWNWPVYVFDWRLFQFLLVADWSIRYPSFPLPTHRMQTFLWQTASGLDSWSSKPHPCHYAAVLSIHTRSYIWAIITSNSHQPYLSFKLSEFLNGNEWIYSLSLNLHFVFEVLLGKPPKCNPWSYGVFICWLFFSAWNSNEEIPSLYTAVNFSNWMFSEPHYLWLSSWCALAV
jgi:hypothetical protein